MELKNRKVVKSVYREQLKHFSPHPDLQLAIKKEDSEGNRFGLLKMVVEIKCSVEVLKKKLNNTLAVEQEGKEAENRREKENRIRGSIQKTQHPNVSNSKEREHRKQRKGNVRERERTFQN